jgi:hypothetical protein
VIELADAVFDHLVRGRIANIADRRIEIAMNLWDPDETKMRRKNERPWRAGNTVAPPPSMCASKRSILISDRRGARRG